MATAGHAEIAGGGIAGLVAAAALAQRGWTVRVHERADHMRAYGAAIFAWYNLMRVLKAVGAYDEAVAGGSPFVVRESRDARNRVINTILASPRPEDRIYSVSRRQMIQALASAAARSGAEISVSSVGVAADPAGALLMAGRPAAPRRPRHRRRRRALEGARQPRPRAPPPAPARRRHAGPDPAHRGGAPVGAGAEIDRVLVGAAADLLLRLQPAGGVSRLHAARRRRGGIGGARQPGGVDPLVPASRGRHPARRRGGALGPLRAHRPPPLVEGPRRRRRGRRQRHVAQYRPGRGHRGDECAVPRRLRLRGAVDRGGLAPVGGAESDRSRSTRRWSRASGAASPPGRP